MTHNAIHALLECEICLEPYSSSSEDRKPASWPCGHTTCLGCAQALLQRDPRECPICRVQVPRSLWKVPVNFTVLQLADLILRHPAAPSSPPLPTTLTAEVPEPERPAASWEVAEPPSVSYSSEPAGTTISGQIQINSQVLLSEEASDNARRGTLEPGQLGKVIDIKPQKNARPLYLVVPDVGYGRPWWYDQRDLVPLMLFDPADFEAPDPPAESPESPVGVPPPAPPSFSASADPIALSLAQLSIAPPVPSLAAEPSPPPEVVTGAASLPAPAVQAVLRQHLEHQVTLTSAMALANDQYVRMVQAGDRDGCMRWMGDQITKAYLQTAMTYGVDIGTVQEIRRPEFPLDRGMLVALPEHLR